MKITSKGLVVTALVITTGAVAIFGKPEFAIIFVASLALSIITLED